MADKSLTQEYLHSIFDYKDGNLYRKSNGKKAGAKKGDGYIRSGIKNKSYSNHRMIFMMHHGYLPEFVDHIDGNKANNKIENLRAATRAENNRNTGLSSINTSGIKGVTWNKPRKKWQVNISVDRKLMCLGHFDNLELAELVAIEARNKYHGQFARNK